MPVQKYWEVVESHVVWLVYSIPFDKCESVEQARELVDAGDASDYVVGGGSGGCWIESAELKEE